MATNPMSELEKIIKSCQIDIGHHRYGDGKRRQLRNCCNIDIDDFIFALRQLLHSKVPEKTSPREIQIAPNPKFEKGRNQTIDQIHEIIDKL